MMVNTFFEGKVDQLVDLAKRFAAALTAAGIDYRLVGGFAVYLHVDRVSPENARLTRDIDVAIRRSDLEAIAEAVKPFGFEYRHTAGVDMIVDANRPSGRVVHLLSNDELPEGQVLAAGLKVAELEYLVQAKLSAFRLKDRVHVQDMSNAGLITAEIEASLPEPLRERLAHIRATE